MIYRQATTSDFPILASMRWDFQNEFKDAKGPLCSKEDFITAFIDFSMVEKSLFHFVAENNHEIVAHISVHVINKIPKPGELCSAIGYVTNTYTKPEYRNQGIGTKLLQHLINFAQQQPIELLIAWPSEQSVTFYERNGFTTKNTIVELILKD
jgi:ribosomal protein S18 acetylase RimI-like enzyme